MTRTQTRIRLLVAALAAVALAVASAAAPRAARADDATHIWGIGTLGETCSGTCGSTNICCKIVVVKQVAPGP